MGDIVFMMEHKPRRTCSVDGCSARYFGAGYCGRHYQRVRSHGHAEETRPADWGHRKNHPRYQAWQNMLRRGAGHDVAWEDFDAFLTDTGVRPSEDHVLCPARPGEPIGPDNFRWVQRGKGLPRARRESEGCRVKGCKARVHALDLCTKHHARWLRRDTLEDPAPRVVDIEKKKARRAAERLAKYRMTAAEYERQLAAQNFQCAICGRAPDQRPLSVDHCHGSGAVRGLLCQRCNTGLGMFGDSVERIYAAIQYLRPYKKVGKVS